MILQLSFNGMDSFPYLLLLPVLLIWFITLVAIANGSFYNNTTKVCWFFLVLFLNIAGVLLFLGWGRKEVAWDKK